MEKKNKIDPVVGSGSTPAVESKKHQLEWKQFYLAVVALILGALGSWWSYNLGRSITNDERELANAKDKNYLKVRQEMEAQFAQLTVEADEKLNAALARIAGADNGVQETLRSALLDAGSAGEKAKSALGKANAANAAAELAKKRADEKAKSVDEAIKLMEELRGNAQDIAKVIASQLTSPGSPLHDEFMSAAFKSVTQKQDEKIENLAAQTTLLSKQANSLERDLSMARAPIGSIVAWPSDVKRPEGWVICKGQKLNEVPGGCSSRLKTVIGATYRLDKEDDDRLPNFEGRFLRGHGGRSAAIGKLQEDALKQHQHGLPNDVAKRGGRDGGAGGKNGTVSSHLVAPAGDVIGHSDPHETRPTNYAIHWIIRVR